MFFSHQVGGKNYQEQSTINMNLNFTSAKNVCCVKVVFFLCLLNSCFKPNSTQWNNGCLNWTSRGQHYFKLEPKVSSRGKA